MVHKLKLGAQLEPTKVLLNAANNSSLHVLGSIKIWVEFERSKTEETKNELNYGAYQMQVDSIDAIYTISNDPTTVLKEGNSYLIEFIAVDQLSVPVLLGTKGIKQMNMKLDFQTEQIMVDNYYYPFVNHQRRDTLRTTKEATIPPYSISSVEVIGDLKQANYSIESIPTSLYGQIIEAGYSAKEGKNIFKILVKNTNNFKIRLPSNFEIATAINPTIPQIEPETTSFLIAASDENSRTIAAIKDTTSHAPNQVKDQSERKKEVEAKRMKRDEMIVGASISKRERDILFATISAEEKIFKEKLTEEIRENVLPKYTMKLQPNATPHIAAMGRLSPDKEQILEEEIADLLKRGLI